MTQFKTVAVDVPESQNDIRLDRFLSTLVEISSRSRATQLIHQNLILNSQGEALTKPSYKVRNGERIVVRIPVFAETTKLEPLELELEILFEDQDLLVVNKPSGLVVHPAAGHAQDTLVNALIHQVKDLSMGFGENRPGIVHRLDKDTSGLLVVAKNDFSQEFLAKQFKDKSVHRVYKAIVFGHPKNSEGTVISFLQRHPMDRKRFASEKIKKGEEPKGKKAITHYKILENFPCGLSLVQCQLETGRTHQIRVHLTEMQHTIIGDLIYGSKARVKNLKSTKLRGQILNLNRIGLHAEQLGFIHPRTKVELLFSKPWPNEMLNLVKNLSKES